MLQEAYTWERDANLCRAGPVQRRCPETGSTARGRVQTLPGMLGPGLRVEEPQRGKEV